MGARLRATLQRPVSLSVRAASRSISTDPQSDSSVRACPAGWLEGNKNPTAEDFRKAFPLSTPDWGALAQPLAGAIQALWVRH